MSRTRMIRGGATHRNRQDYKKHQKEKEKERNETLNEKVKKNKSDNAMKSKLDVSSSDESDLKQSRRDIDHRKKKKKKKQQVLDQNDKDTFYDAGSEDDEFHWYTSDTFSAGSEDDEFHWYISDTFSTKVLKATVNEETLKYYDPSDDMSEKFRFGKAFHLTIDYDAFHTQREEAHQFIRDTSVNQALQELTLEGMYGYIPLAENFDTYTFAVLAVHRFRDEDLEQL